MSAENDIVVRARKDAARYHPHATGLIRDLAAEIVRLRREVAEARGMVEEANNSLYGSHGYFHSLNGGPYDKYHLANGIEELKSRTRAAYRASIAPEEAKGDLSSRMYRGPSHPDTERANLLDRRSIAEESPQPADGGAVAWVEVGQFCLGRPEEWGLRGSQLEAEDQPLYTHPPAAQVQAAPQEGVCMWDYDEDTDAWNGTCGSMWQFTAGDPDDNDMHYCPKCGKRCALQHRGDSRGGEGSP